MTFDEEDFIYDCVRKIIDNSDVISDVINKCGNDMQRQAYHEGIHTQVIRLQYIIGHDAVLRGIKRHEKEKKDSIEVLRRRPKVRIK